MNYQLLIESFSFGTTLSSTEIELLILELDTQIINLEISKDLEFLKPAPSHVCKGLKLRKGSFWITCLAEVIDIHKSFNSSRTKGVVVYDLLLAKKLVVG